MKSPRLADLAFLTFTAVLVAAATAGGALLWPTFVAAAHKQAGELVRSATSAKDLREAQVDYQLALQLHPGNQSARLGLAKTQIASGQAEAALATLEPAGEGSEAAQLRLRTLAELGRTSEAADRAAALARAGRADSDLVLAGLVYALAGRAGDIPALIPLVTSPQAAQSLTRAASGNLPLATELYASGLPESSRRLLQGQPASFQRNLLLARIYYARHTTADLAEASRYLETAIKLNPAQASAHQLLATIYTEQNRPIESKTQSNLTEKLLSGRP